jgi:integrase
MELQAAIDRYIQLRAAKRQPGTVRMEACELGLFLRATGNLKLATLTAKHVERYFYDPDTGRHQELSAASFNNSRARLFGFLRWCQDEGHIKSNLMREVERRKVYQKERLRLTPEQMLEAINQDMHPRDRIAVALACNTAMRVSSLTELRVGDVDLERGAIRYVNVKSQRERELPITADLDRELRRWLTWYTDQEGPLQPDWYLIPSRPRGGGHLALEPGEHGPVIPTKPASNIKRIAHRVLEGIGLDAKGEGFHTFRRSVARAVFEAGMEAGDPRAIYIVKELCDHENVETTQRYVGTSFEKEKLDEMLRGKSFLAPKVVDTAAEQADVVSMEQWRQRRVNAG